MEVKHVTIYTDGGCIGNPGPGGYGVILRYGNHEKQLSGGFRLTTNNRMELSAAIEGLKALKYKCKVSLFSDSKYLVDAFNQGWIYNWKKKNWRKGDKGDVQNIDLWQKLYDLMKKHDVTLHWVKGHAGHFENEICDKLAVEAANRNNLPPDDIFERENPDLFEQYLKTLQNRNSLL
ncbi:MAG: ribonuclease HI [Deltaproteobacteria bacterium]|nr:ribonuclease HI [Deltaproteobacteria bacterium]